MHNDCKGMEITRIFRQTNIQSHKNLVFKLQQWMLADMSTLTHFWENCELRATVVLAVRSADVVALKSELQNKQCSSDPLPTRLLKKNINILARFFFLAFSLVSGIWCLSYLHEICLHHAAEKKQFDSADIKSHRPISNLLVISKLHERIACKQLLSFLKDNNMLFELHRPTGVIIQLKRQQRKACQTFILRWIPTK